MTMTVFLWNVMCFLAMGLYVAWRRARIDAHAKAKVRDLVYACAIELEKRPELAARIKEEEEA